MSTNKALRILMTNPSTSNGDYIIVAENKSESVVAKVDVSFARTENVLFTRGSGTTTDFLLPKTRLVNQ